MVLHAALPKDRTAIESHRSQAGKQYTKMLDSLDELITKVGNKNLPGVPNAKHTLSDLRAKLAAQQQAAETHPNQTISATTRLISVLAKERR